MDQDPKNKSELIFCQTEDGRTRLEVQLVNESVWLTQAQMAELFQRERSVIAKHILNVFEEEELDQNSVCAKYAHTAADGKTYQTTSYNLDVIISCAKASGLCVSPPLSASSALKFVSIRAHSWLNTLWLQLSALRSLRSFAAKNS